jgi:hypothetical protein
MTVSLTPARAGATKGMTMTLEELKAEAAKILAIEPAAGFQHVTFSTGSGGLRNLVGIPEVHRDSKFKYDTVANGRAYANTVVVECRDTGTKDSKGRTIYETTAGVMFVYSYSSGSPDRFDGGSLREPVLK